MSDASSWFYRSGAGFDAAAALWFYRDRARRAGDKERVLMLKSWFAIVPRQTSAAFISGILGTAV